ncbi:MAG: hypothetical protein M1130_06510 [Actinobacteria bacterium]|nr:hypothetical protein [Actinomycetota bacterium]
MSSRAIWGIAASTVILIGLAFLLRASGAAPALTGALPAFRGGGNFTIGAQGTPGRVVVVTMDYLQVRDLEGGLPPNMAAMAAGGATALMNVNTGRNVTPENTHATIGAGAHAVAALNSPAQGLAASDRVEAGTAADEYFRRTGRAPPAGSLVYLDIARMRLMNEALNYTVIPGALGEILHEAGMRTAALGNSDDSQGPKRQVMSIAMDSEGIVDTGSVGRDALRPDREFTGGQSTDYSGILREYEKLPPDVRLVAVDLGDLGRLQGSREYMARDHWNVWRGEVIRRSDEFIGGLMGRMDLKKDLLILASPTPGDDGEKRDKMSPVIMCGGNIPRGLLVSPTTKRPGVIMNVDIAPTALSFLGLSSTGVFTGRPAGVVPGEYGVETAVGMYRVIESVNEARPYLQKGYVFFQLILLAVSLGFIFMKKKGKEYLQPFFLAVMSVPLAYLLMTLFPAAGIPVEGLKLVLFTALLTCLFIFISEKWGIDTFLLVSSATFLVITADILAGSPLQKVSIMSYDPVVGARFYGLGNEYMGVLIGSALVGTTSLIQYLEKRRSFLIAFSGAAYAFIVYVIAAPQLGTNVGGTIAASSAFLVTFLLTCGISLSWRPVLAVASTVVAVVLALTLYDSGRPVQCQSHIGRAAAQVMTGGLDEVINIITRKSEINIKLIKYTIWSRIFLSSLAMLALLFYRPPGVMEGVRGKRPFLFKGLVGVIAGSIVAFIFNDSGVVAAATTMIFGVPLLIYLVLDQLEGI